MGSARPVVYKVGAGNAIGCFFKSMSNGIESTIEPLVVEEGARQFDSVFGG